MRDAKYAWNVSVLMRDGWRLWPVGGDKPLSWQEAMDGTLPELIASYEVVWKRPGWRPEPPEPRP
jgi:hypothetical protein